MVPPRCCRVTLHLLELAQKKVASLFSMLAGWLDMVRRYGAASQLEISILSCPGSTWPYLPYPKTLGLAFGVFRPDSSFLLLAFLLFWASWSWGLESEGGECVGGMAEAAPSGLSTMRRSRWDEPSRGTL